ncbi:hypothetical protein [Mycobacterium sp. 852002-51057_SCH5723018]|uniref:hypothetical protein n=1 Tax=Mycobacterium sp. 852002-51057_SCH5723018 TaxID=1834094 RepID=UPI0008006348|nr:hypothetical protein [Mycobacterium sp. 852002-51057_SCH5723018]OBG25299.1 hypothetical protein A5764_07925 [Mycobacterium sp. 852002-51057_SCH5723018]
MAGQPEVRHDKITAPQRLPTFHVQALAMQKAQMKARGARVFDLQLGDSYPVGGDQGTDREWSYSYQLAPPGGQAATGP